MRWVRTCRACRAGQIAPWLLTRRCGIRIGLVGRWDGLPVRAVQLGGLSHTAPDGMCGDKSLGLRRDWSEDAVLVEPHAIGAAAVLCRFEARASDLRHVLKKGSLRRSFLCPVGAVTYLASPAIPAGNGSPLARSWRLVAMVHVIGWWRLRSIGIRCRRGPGPFVRARETVRLLRVLMSGHVGSGLLRRGWWRKTGVDLRKETKGQQGCVERKREGRDIRRWKATQQRQDP